MATQAYFGILAFALLVSAAPAPTSTTEYCIPTTIAPYIPPGGIDVNATTPPVYVPMSEFDYQSLTLALHQEYIELDLFNYALQRFSDEEFDAAGITAADRLLIGWMAEQEVGHAAMLTNILGPNATQRCTYSYPFDSVREFVDFSQKLTRFGESGVYGFLEHLDSRSAAQLLLQSIATEARQQMIFEQFEGLFPMPVWFEPGISQSMAWTLLAPYITACPAENTPLVWQNFPALNITDDPDASTLPQGFDNNTFPSVTPNQTIIVSYPGRQVNFTWELPGQAVGWNNTYVTNTTAGPAQFAAWISQLNITYTPLDNVNGTSATTSQPGALIYGNGTTPIVNGTMFIVITDDDPYITPGNISLLNAHIVAGPALYESG